MSEKVHPPQEPEAVHADSPAGSPETKPALSRRKLLAAGAGAAAAAALSPFGARPALGQHDHYPEEPDKAMGPMDVNFEAHGEDFEHPLTMISRAGEMVQNLIVRPADKMVRQLDGTMRVEQTRTYNGTVPGPTFQVTPGTKLSFTLFNRLPANPDQAMCHELMGQNQPNCFNTTNLHTHGLHVSPSSKQVNGSTLASDDVLIELQPGQNQQYCIWLPDFHAPGTHWYHAHKHGSTAIQVVNGMAGALIVEEPPEQKIPVDSERIWLLQEIVGNQNDSASKIYTCGPPTPRFTVNGVDTPMFTMLPNEIQRWRFVNATASPRGFMDLFVRKQGTTTMVPIYLIAIDGITFYGWDPQPVPGPGRTTGLTFSPGNRADFLVQLPAGTYEVVKGQSAIAMATSEQVLAVVEVSGTAMPERPLPKLPGTGVRPCYLTPIPDSAPTNTRTITFGETGPGCGGMKGQPIPQKFTINGVQFGNPAAVQNVDFGATEKWQLANSTGAAHPFHIHVNPFQIVGNLIDYTQPDSPENRVWWDTIPIPGNNTASPLQMLTRFLDYSGSYVFHCHILIHEDLGMMQEVVVGPGGVGPCEQLASPVTPC
jgi:FtsP/CotA-like multicopper oxidase with cupredoxin domain